MRTLVLRSLRAHRASLTLTLLAVTLSVGFVTASFVLADSLRAVFGDVSSEIYGGVDAELRSPDADLDGAAAVRFSETVLADLDAVDGVSHAVPVVEGRNAVFAVGRDGEVARPQGPPVLAFSSVGDSPASPFTTLSGRAPETGEVALDQVQADALGVTLGDSVEIASPLGTERYELVGTVAFGDFESGVNPYFLLFELDTIQRLLSAEGTVDAVSVVFDTGVDTAVVLDRLEAAAPQLVVADRAELVDEQEAEFGEVIDIIQTALLVFAGVTLFVSTFVIANTFAVLVGRRQRQLGLLRAIGATPRQAATLVVGEAALVGVAASVLGIGGGILIAEAITTLFEAVTDGGFPVAPRQLRPRTLVLGPVVGVGVTVLSAVIPALRAGQVSPLEAMGRDERAPSTGPSIGARSLAAFAAVVVGRLGTSGRLAATSISRNPRRVLTTAMSMIVGIGLISVMSVLAASYRSTIADTVDSSFDGDLIVTGTDGATVPYRALDGLAAAPYVDAFSGFGTAEVRVGDEVVPIAGFQPASAGGVVELELVAGSESGLDDAAAAITSELAQRRSLGIGDVVPVEFSDGVVVELDVEAVVVPPAAIDADVLVHHELVAAHARDVDADLAVIRFADGVDEAAALASVTTLLADHPQLRIDTMDEYLAGREAQAQQLLVLANGLLALTVIIALSGIANTMALGLLERRHELGLLRAVGMGRHQVRTMVRYEAMVLSLFGALAGLVIGVAVAVAVAPFLPEAFVSSVEIPFGALGVHVGVGVLLGVLASVGPARRAARVDVLEALRPVG